MAYELIKDENYQNLRGIDVKTSLYKTPDGAFLDLRNYCFERLGSITSRPGITVSATQSIQHQSLSPQTIGNYVKSTGESYLIYDYGQTLRVLNDGTGIFSSLTSGATISLRGQGVVSNDFYYYANGHAFVRAGGSLAVQYNHVSWFDIGTGVTFNLSLISTSSVTTVINPGFYQFWVAGCRGFVSNGSPTYSSIGPFYYNENATEVYDSPDIPIGGGVTVSATIIASTGQWIIYGMAQNQGIERDLGLFFFDPSYGYSSFAVGMVLPGASTSPVTANAINNGLRYNDVRLGGPHNVFATTFGGSTLLPFIKFDHFTANDDSLYFQRQDRSFDSVSQALFYDNPKYLSLYNNMLFQSGFTTAKNKVRFSNILEPENYPENNFFNVLSNDDDIITTMGIYQDGLFVFKKRSFFEVRGDSPDTLSVRPANTDYGCVSETGFVSLEDVCYFCDYKGIVEFDGTNVNVISYPVQDYYFNLNKESIRASHLKIYNQIWFQSDTITLVYDYLTKSWGIYDGFNSSNDTAAITTDYGSTLSELHYFSQGASSLNLNRFSASFFTDFGANITLLFKTRFHKRLGESTTEMWRRLFVNSDQDGVTLGATVNFYPDYGDSASLSRSMPLSSFQERIDFGLSAKSMSVEMIISAQTKVRINGYTIEARFLRNV